MVKLEPVFPCSDTLREAYGFCSHITRKQTDFPLRKNDLLKLREAGASWVRSDFDWWTLYSRGILAGEQPGVFDTVTTDCGDRGIHLLPILVADCDGGHAWDNPEAYNDYVRYVAERYQGSVDHWEVINEVNLIKKHEPAELAKLYANTLRETARTLRIVNPDNKVVLGGLAEVCDDFLNRLSEEPGFSESFDIMNFHSYLSPEELIESMNRLRNIMDRWEWRKPVWITETGYTTPPEGTSTMGFFNELVPYACRQLGFDARQATFGYVCAPNAHFDPADECSETLASTFNKIVAIAPDELKTLDPKKVPLLMPSINEYFPNEWLDDLRGYVQRGGTLVCPNGVPFYYDAYEDGHYANRHGSHAKDFHMDFLLWWNDDARQAGAPEIPTWTGTAKGCQLNYRWDFSAQSSARYLTDRNLATGDTFTPYLMAGNDKYKGAVAGLYNYNSNLKGAAIVQTRIDRPWRTETQQAQRVARAYLIAFAYGVEKVFWYHLRAFEEHPTDWEHYFGVLHKDFTPKPAYVAYQALTRLCPDGSTRPTLVVEGNRYHATWTHPELGQVSAYWAVGGKQTMKLEGRPKAIYNYLGEAQKMSHDLQLSAAVTYVVEGDE